MKDLLHEAKVAGELTRSVIKAAKSRSNKGERQVVSIVEIVVAGLTDFLRGKEAKAK